MAYYHCSPYAGLTVLTPQKPTHFNKPARVYLTTLLPMALMYAIKNYEYTYGYTDDGKIYFYESFPNALEILYREKSASLYLCSPETTTLTSIPNEAVSENSVPVIKETHIADAYEALLEQELAGDLIIHRYNELSNEFRNCIREEAADEIRKNDLINTPGKMADYYRTNYPESWTKIQNEYKRPD